ncbi:MAG: hypothetical protein AAB198_05815 [Actinomycetota bacterium]
MGRVILNVAVGVITPDGETPSVTADDGGATPLMGSNKAGTRPVSRDATTPEEVRSVLRDDGRSTIDD